MTVKVIEGDCRDVLRATPAKSVHCVVTSPPYWGMRDYGVAPSLWDDDQACEHEWGEHVSVNATNHTTKARWNHTRNGRDELQPTEKRVSWLRTEVKQGQFCQKCGAWTGALGLEPDYQMFVAHIVDVFREVRRVLRDDGTLWLNLGDTYQNAKGQAHGVDPTQPARRHGLRPQDVSIPGLKPKDLVGIPWRVAFALQEDGWWLRQDIIWAKPNPMPESVTDRCTKAHEYLFLLSKSARYYFDADAIAETAVADHPPGNKTHKGATAYEEGQKEHRTKAGLVAYAERQRGTVSRSKDKKSAARNPNSRPHSLSEFEEKNGREYVTRNRRSVWNIATQPFPEAHFATFPPELVEPCILAGSPKGGAILDPFGGAGTTGLVADRLGRDAILIELNPGYAAMARERIVGDAPMFAEVSA